ncbi:MAG: histidine kinase [bacterium]|nr:histidine kinase [bacterium]
MKSFIINLLRISIYFFYGVGFLSLFVFLFRPTNGIGMLESIQPISISGLVSIDHGPEEAIQNTTWNDGIRHSLIVRGYFNKDIRDGNSLIIWPRNLRVKIYVNGIERLSAGQRESFPDYIEYAGNSFQIFYIGDVATTDLIQIEVEKAYDSCRINVINSFFNNMYVGREGAVYQSIMRHELIHPLIGLTLTFVGILIVLSTLSQAFNKFLYMEKLNYLGLFCISGGICYIYDSCYEYIDLLFPYVLFNTILDLCCIPLLLFSYLMIVINTLENHKTKRFVSWITSIYVLITVTAFLFQMTGIQDLHIMQDLYLIVGEIIVLLSFTALIYELIYLKNKQLRKTFIATLPLIVSLSLKAVNVLLEHGIERRYIRMGILISCVMLIHSTLNYLKKTGELIEREKQMKLEIQNAQIRIMLSQIQPHFLYNALNTLQHICKTNGVLAAEAIEHFSRYLRGNMDSLTTNRPIPFTWELEHVKHYIYIEQLRFGDRVRIEYDLETTDFYIPTLTLQPIVENAIRHGITKQAEGGTVTILTRKKEDEILIKVCDNGVGLSPEQPEGKERSHIGIDNVKKRLMLQCNGTIEILSTHGTGTEVIIHLKGADLEHHESDSRR